MTFLETQLEVEVRCQNLQNFIDKGLSDSAYDCVTYEEIRLIETTIEQLRAISEKIYGKQETSR